MKQQRKKKKKLINSVHVVPNLDMPLVSEDILERFKQISAPCDSVRKGIRKAFTK